LSAPLVTLTESGFHSENAFTGPADQWRQDSQWQYPIASGDPDTSSSTAPQKQLPLTDVLLLIVMDLQVGFAQPALPPTTGSGWTASEV